MKHFGVLTVAALTCLLVSTRTAHSAHLTRDTDTLKGLRDVVVYVELQKPSVEQAGLSRKQLIADVEQHLRPCGIRVLTPQQGRRTPGTAFLFLGVDTIREHGRFFYVSQLQLLQRVSLKRRPQDFTWAGTWERDHCGKEDASGVRDTIRQLVDTFATEYASVNPKK